MRGGWGAVKTMLVNYPWLSMIKFWGANDHLTKHQMSQTQTGSIVDDVIVLAWRAAAYQPVGWWLRSNSIVSCFTETGAPNLFLNVNAHVNFKVHMVENLIPASSASYGGRLLIKSKSKHNSERHEEQLIQMISIRHSNACSFGIIWTADRLQMVAKFIQTVATMIQKQRSAVTSSTELTLLWHGLQNFF